MGRSQPATSVALGRLRKVFNDPLFIRTGALMLPTARCTALAQEAARAIADFMADATTPPAFMPAASQREFSVTMVDVGELHVLPRLMAYLQREAPHCRLRSESIPAERVAAALTEGSCELAIGIFPNLVVPTLHMQALSTHRFSCVVRADHPLVRTARIELDQYLALSHLVVRPAGVSHDTFEAALMEYGCKRSVQLVTSHFVSVPSIIAATDLIATVPMPVADYCVRSKKLRIVEPPIEVEAFPIRMYWHPHLEADPAVGWLREAVTRLFGTASV